MFVIIFEWKNKDSNEHRSVMSSKREGVIFYKTKAEAEAAASECMKLSAEHETEPDEKPKFHTSYIFQIENVLTTAKE